MQYLHAEWVTFLPFPSSENNEFTGSVIVEQWNGEFEKGYTFMGGGDTFYIEPDEAQTYRKISYKFREYCFTINQYGYISVGGYDGPMQLVGSETYCAGTANNGETQKSAAANDGGGTSAEDYPPDCAMVPGGTACVDPNCNTCIGGTTGLTGCADIKHKLDSFPCAKNLVNQMPNND